jgi:hypothetical protein
MQSPTLLSTLVENESIFVCKGYSTIKVTRDGKAELFKLPIKTNGVAEYQEKIASQAPRPPSTMEFVKADSAEGRALGLTKDALQRVFDLTDEAYVKAINAHNDEFNWRVAVYGLDIEWKKADGRLAETYEEKKAILASNGITGPQLTKIFFDIGELSRFAMEREDFLSAS